MLAIQGGFAEHMQALERHSNVEAVEVRTPFELGGVDALILPGGESTAIGMGLVDTNMLDDVKDFVKTKPAWGVCAGMILLANELDEGASQPLIGGLDINVKRNAFGRQSKSALRSMETSGAAAEAGNEAYFIRAPAVTRVGDDVEILASVPGDGVVRSCHGRALPQIRPSLSTPLSSAITLFLTLQCSHLCGTPPVRAICVWPACAPVLRRSFRRRAPWLPSSRVT